MGLISPICSLCFSRSKVATACSHVVDKFVAQKVFYRSSFPPAFLAKCASNVASRLVNKMTKGASRCAKLSCISVRALRFLAKVAQRTCCILPSCGWRP